MLFTHIHFVHQGTFIRDLRMRNFPGEIFNLCLKQSLLVFKESKSLTSCALACWTAIGVGVSVLKSVPTFLQRLCRTQQRLPIDPRAFTGLNLGIDPFLYRLVVLRFQSKASLMIFPLEIAEFISYSQARYKLEYL